MSDVIIMEKGITDIKADALVNAANAQLLHGSGVCGAIFSAAGAVQLQTACNKIGGCKTGNAVITPGFKLCKYIIHAVGPQYIDGLHNEDKLLYSSYKQSLTIAMNNNVHSIVFPLISAGIYGYPVKGAWHKALQACFDFIDQNADYDITIYFAIPSQTNYSLGVSEIKKHKSARDH